jgi:Carbon dioxide concentrating mechanism/carboxysome shell protein
MIIGKVVGNVWATKKDEKLDGNKLLVIKSKSGGQVETFVAVDNIGAGVGDDVLVTKGSMARNSLQAKDSPVDAAVVGIIDSLEVDEQILL